MENFPQSCTFSPICLQPGWQVVFFSLLKMLLKQKLFNPASLARHLWQCRGSMKLSRRYEVPHKLVGPGG